MALLKVKNWRSHQHYKDRNPPWIKIETNTFSNYDFSRLQDASKLLAVCIWTIAARTNDGTLPDDFEYIKKQCCLGQLVKEEHLKELITQGFIERDSTALAECKQSACLEGETEKREKRASRIPADFAVTDLHRKFSADHHYPDPDSEIHKFIDHFKSKPGKDGTSLDWNARFRVWLSKAQQYGGTSNGNQSGFVNRGRARLDAQRAELERSEKLDQERAGDSGDFDERDDPGRSLERVRVAAAGVSAPSAKGSISARGNNPEILPKAR